MSDLRNKYTWYIKFTDKHIYLHAGTMLQVSYASMVKACSGSADCSWMGSQRPPKTFGSDGGTFSLVALAKYVSKRSHTVVQVCIFMDILTLKSAINLQWLPCVTAKPSLHDRVTSASGATERTVRNRQRYVEVDAAGGADVYWRIGRWTQRCMTGLLARPRSTTIYRL